MLKTLIKKQLLELFQTYYVDRKTGKARKKAGTVLFFVFFVALLLGLGLVFYNVSTSLGAYVLNRGFNWLYFALMGLLSMALGLFGSVFNTYASVYLPKDNEMLLALPIPTRTLLLSRMVSIYLMSLLYSGWIWIPAIIAYFVMVPLEVTNVIFPILLTFVVALFVSVLSCILGFVVAIISQKAKGKSFLTVFLSLVVMGGYYVVYFKIVNSLDEVLEHIDEWSSTVKSWLHYSYNLGLAADGELLPMLGITAITVVLAVLCVFILSKSFRKVALSSGRTEKKEKTTAVDYSSVKPEKALLKREYKHFTSVATWMLNGGFGLMLLVLGAIAALIKHKAIENAFSVVAEEAPGLNMALPVILAAATCLILSSSSVLPVSISIEGKSLWILQSLPVDPWMILRSKERMGVQLSMYPAAFFVVIMGKILGFEMWEILLVLTVVLAFVYLNSDFGLYLNIKKPNFAWTSEATLTKQSMPVVVNMFGGWLFCGVTGLLGGYLCQITGSYIALAAMAVLFLLFRQLLFFWLKKKGTKLLQYMS